MRSRPCRRRALGLLRLSVICAWTAALSVAVAQPAMPSAQPAGQRDFDSADQAADALIAAMRADDEQALLGLLGPQGEPLVHSGDAVADRQGRERTVRAYDEAHRVEAQDGAATLLVGKENWPMPIPIVEQQQRWHFDTAAGFQKILDRRVGRNELNVIEVCRAYVQAQREYALQHLTGSGTHEYARKFSSSPGKRDGLFWESAAGEPPSPMGPLVVRARAEGYPKGDGDHPPRAPYHGYYYRILTRQGSHAPGGAKDYVVDDHMSRGFALLAYPARWGDSGIMTFVVNQSGIVFQKNLGPDTERLAPAIDAYDPDSSWSTP